MSEGTLQLVVFADDWGRHPSSCQHLVRRLLPRHPALWVNTIGTRMPGLSAGDIKKIAAKAKEWLGPARPAAALPANLGVISPRMWPGFRRRWQRGFNAKSIARGVHGALGARQEGQRRVAITTLPITADLVGKLDVDRWVYYCVDDFSVWPGLDGPVMQEMERQLVKRVDAVVAVSETLVERLSGLGRRDVTLLTHGIDLGHWAAQPSKATQPTVSPQSTPHRTLPAWWSGLERPIILFWGLIDTRLDVSWCRALVEALDRGTLVLVGPTQSPDPALAGLPRIKLPGAVGYEDLPALAAAADVLVMPYADLPVTRAMQPLKFKEYLAAGLGGKEKPVVVRDLPATQPWSDAADVVSDADQFVRVVKQRMAAGVPTQEQIRARVRLAVESWENKASVLESIIRV